MVCYSHPGEGGNFSEKQLEKSICIKTGISCSIQLGTAEVPHHQLVLGKRPVQKSTDSFLQAPTQLPGLPRGPAPHRRCSPVQAGSIPLVLSNQEEGSRGSRPGPHLPKGNFSSCLPPKIHPTKHNSSSNPGSFTGDKQQNRQTRLIPSPPVAEEANLLPGEFYQLFSVVIKIMVIAWAECACRTGSSSKPPSNLHRSLAQPGRRAKEVSPPVHG